MTAETKSYLIPYQWYVWNSSDTIATTETTGISGSLGATTVGNSENLWPVGTTVAVDIFYIDIANNNTVDGAFVDLVFNRVANTDFRLVVDQASGTFQINTAFATIGNRTAAIGPSINSLYTENNNTIVGTSIGARCYIT